jgi:predicted Zn-dependent peptidase
MTLAFSLDSPADLAGWYGAGEVLATPESFEARCRRVEAVTPAEVQRVAQAAFRRARTALVVVGRLGRRTERQLEKVVEAGPLAP